MREDSDYTNPAGFQVTHTWRQSPEERAIVLEQRHENELSERLIQGIVIGVLGAILVAVAVVTVYRALS